MKMGLYARVSTHDQQTLALQQEAMVAYARQRGGSIVMTVEEVGSGVSERLKRDALMRAARRRDIDVVVVWRLDRLGRSIKDLIAWVHWLEQEGARPLHHRMMTYKDLAFFSPPKICQRGVVYPQCHS